MSAKHTPGPWKVRKSVTNPGAILEQVSTSIVADGVVICQVHEVPTESCMSADENARRIVACVNACEGIETSELEEIAVSGGMLGPREDVARIAKQRDELLMALQLALPALEYLRKQFPRSEHDDSIDALAITKAAIAKTTGAQQ